MKRKFILIPSMLAAVLLLLSFEGCKKNDAKGDELVGSWYCETIGEYDDVIKTDLIIKNNGEAEFIWSSDAFPEEEPESERIACKWKVDDKELVFTSSDWDDEELRFEYEISGDVLILDPNDNCYFELTRK